MLRRAREVLEPGGEPLPGFGEISEIGAGALSTVYRAREHATRRLVALKVLKPGHPHAFAAFERQARALGALSGHPHIVTVYRTLRTADGRPVVVRELCTGSLGGRLRGGAGVPAAAAVPVAIKLAGALETAHRSGVLHRDVSPRHILLTRDGEPALADLGVAALHAPTGSAAGLCEASTLHAPPELLEGTGAGPATDVYELASTLYQMIAGRAAFGAVPGEAPASLILRILRDAVPALPARTAPGELGELLAQAMAKRAADRPPSAAAFAAALGEVERHQGWTPTRATWPGDAAASRPGPLREPAGAGARGAGSCRAGAGAPEAVGPPDAPLVCAPRRLRLRAGAASLTVDERRLRLRTWLHATELPWDEVVAVERRLQPRRDAPARSGYLVAVTRRGPVELPATRLPLADLRQAHAAVVAYQALARGPGHAGPDGAPGGS